MSSGVDYSIGNSVGYFAIAFVALLGSCSSAKYRYWATGNSTHKVRMHPILTLLYAAHSLNALYSSEKLRFLIGARECLQAR